MIGKYIADISGLTDKLDGLDTHQSKKTLAELSEIQFKKLQQAITNCKGDTIQFQKVLNETFEGGKYANVKGLSDYIKNNSVLNKDSINSLINNQINENIAAQAVGFKGVNDAITHYNTLLIEGKGNEDGFTQAVLNHNTKFATYLANLNGTNASLGGYAKYLVAVKAKTIGLTVATTALNAAISWGVSALTGLIISGLSSAVNYTKNMRENVEKLTTTYQDNVKTLNTNKETLDSVKEQYTTLSKGVDSLGNNVSLTTDQYKEYNKISNQIADMFPSLVTGWDEQGNAILSCKDNIEKLNDAYRQAEINNANSFINNKNSNDIYADWKNQQYGTNGLFKYERGNSESLYQVKNLLSKTNADEIIQSVESDLKSTTGISELISKEKYYKDLGLNISLNDKVKDFSEKDISSFRNKLKQQQSELEKDIENSLTSTRQLAQSYLVVDSDYDNMTEQGKTIASKFTQGLNEGMSKNDMQSYISKLTSVLKEESDNPDVKNAFESLFSGSIKDNNLSPEEIKNQVDNYVSIISSYFEKSPIEIKTQLGFDNVDTVAEQYQNIINDAKTKDWNTSAIKDAEQSLQDEFDKINSEDFHIGNEFGEKIKDGTIQSVFGNVDMDKRTIIEWSDELKETYADALASWNYDPEVGGIDTVFGGSERFGEDLNDKGWEVAFTPILPNGTFLSKDTVEEYINQILEEAYADDGKITDSELKEIDTQGRQIGDTFVQGIYAAIDDNEDYENNGNWAELVGRLMHFSGKKGAVQLAKNAIEEAKESEENFDWDSWFKEHSINTQEEIDKWKEIATAANSAEEARRNYIKVTGTFKDNDILDLGTDTKTKLGELSQQLDSIQSAYSTLSSAVSEYNSNGSISIDTMQSVIGLGDNWLDYIDTETGAFTLDQDALNKLTQSRIEDMKQQALANLADNVSSIQNETDANKYLESTNYDTATSYQELAKAKLIDVEATLRQKVAEGSLSQESYDKIIEKFKADAEKLQKIFDNTSFKLTGDSSIGDSLSGLESHAKVLKTVQEEMEKLNRISSSTLDSICKAYPEMNEVAYSYRNGLITEQELFDKLKECYQKDADSYEEAQKQKVLYSNELWSSVISGNQQLQSVLTSFYGDDWKNWKNLAEAKEACEKKLINSIGSMWYTYFENQLAAFQIIKNADGTFSTTDNEDSPLNKESSSILGMGIRNKINQNTIQRQNTDRQKIDDLIGQYNYALKKMNESINASAPSLDLSDWKALSTDVSDKDSSSSSDKSQTKQDFNWVEPLLSKISKAYDRLKNKVSDTTRTWLNRNNALSDSMETLLSEINAQSDAYDFYTDKFNSYDLDGYYKDQIANGSFNIETVYDDDLKDAISDCQDLYDKAQDAADAVQSLNIEIRQLAKSRFDNIQSQFEGVIGKITAIRDLYGKEDDLMQSQGWFASTLLNNSMMEQEQKNLAKLEQERDALTKALNSAMASGKIEAESEDWYSMQASIDDCTSSIFDAKKALVEYDNAIRQIKWDAFDRTRDDVSNLIDETEFLVGLLKDKGITDDNGNMNDNGKAAQALIAQKYQLYLNQAKAYKDEILKINEELANDPYDKELLDRKQELIKAQQDAINSSISEKDALKDLVQEGYDTFLDKLDEVIQKYKDLMSQQKDAYDYEKSIAEKTKALNALEKQYSAVQGDNSEEGKKNIQQLKDQINTAKDDLKDTEYEKLISDTQAILDNLADTTKTWLDERLDSFDITMQEIIEQSNENATNISQTITDTAENYGYKLSESMSNIWSTNANNITNGINSVLGDFSNKFVEGNNAINKVCGDINAAVQGLLKNSNDEAQRVADEIARQQAEQNANTDGGYSDGGGSSDSGDDWSDNWDNSDSGSSDDSGSDGVNWIYSPDDFPKDELDISSSIVDRIKWHDYDSSFAARSQYYDQMGGEGQYYGTYDQNVFMLDWMKNNGYRKGTKSATSGVHIYDEDNPGSEVIVTKYGTLRQFDSGDTVFSKEQVQKLWDMSKGITALTPNMGLSNIATKLPDIPANSKSMSNKVDVSYGDVSLSFPNVHNYEDFMKQAQQDPKFEKMVQNMTLGQTLGRNSLNKLTFR